jgi:TolB-like protein/DNA-binding winged helix-turn-helix (wHTH) protein/Tfp pilus assembly protein PilF
MTAADIRTGAKSGSEFRLGDLRVDPQTGDVTGPGRRVQLDPKVMGVLAMLAERAGQVVPREDLISRLWPGVVVTDDALSRCLYDLRQELAAAGGSDEYRALVETLPKRGYRLNGVAESIEHPATANHNARRGPWLWTAAVAGIITLVAGVLLSLDREGVDPAPASATPRAVPRIAVLPFDDMSEKRDQQFLADGLTEDILNRLTRSEGLDVIARTSTFALRDQSLNIAEIARRLEVTHVLEGSVRRTEDRIRVTAQLIGAADSAQLWSETYDRDLGDLFTIQDEISMAVAAALETRLVLPAGHETEKVDALVRFAQGEHFYHRRAPGDVERAVAAYTDAVTLDPGYARAWAALAGAYSLLAWSSDPPDHSLIEKQGEAARRAVALAPGLGVAHHRLGQFLFESSDREAARKHWAESARLDPDNPLTLGWQAGLAVTRGDFPAAVGIYRRIIAADPMALSRRTNLAAMLVADGQLEAALEEIRNTRENFDGANPGLDSEIARILILLERFPEAERVLAGMPEGRNRDYGTALLYALPAKRTEANAALARLAMASNDFALEDDIFEVIRLAEIYAFRGQEDEAFATLEGKKEALASRSHINASFLGYLRLEARLSPILKSLHSDRRWAAFIADDA